MAANRINKGAWPFVTVSGLVALSCAWAELESNTKKNFSSLLKVMVGLLF